VVAARRGGLRELAQDVRDVAVHGVLAEHKREAISLLFIPRDERSTSVCAR